MNKIYLSLNYIIVDKNGTISTFPKSSLLNEESGLFTIQKPNRGKTLDIKFTDSTNWFNEAGDTAYTEETLRIFLRGNTNFKDGAGSSLPTPSIFTEITDPLTNEAVTTAVIDAYDEVIITTTMASNPQDMEPSAAGAGKKYRITLTKDSTHTLTVNDAIIEVGSSILFSYDGNAWTKEIVDRLSKFVKADGTTIVRALRLASSTGLISGASPTINGGNAALFDMPLEIGHIVDTTTDPINMPSSPVKIYNPSVGNTLTHLATADCTFLYISDNDTLLQTVTFPTEPERRDNIFLGVIEHPSRTTIKRIDFRPETVMNPSNELKDFLNDILTWCPNGCGIGAGTGLKLNRASGKVSLAGAGIPINGAKQPNSNVLGAAADFTFLYVKQDGEVGSPVSDVDPTGYDLNGVITPIAGSNNQATNVRVYVNVAGDMRVLYGQVLYSTAQEAITALPNESPILPQFLIDHYVLRSTITITKGAVSTSSASFSPASIWGEASVGSGATSVSTLQQVLENSTQPQALISELMGAMVLQSNRTLDASTLSEWWNKAGALVASINGLGDAVFNNVTINGIALVQGNAIQVNSEITTSDAVIEQNDGEVGAGVTLGFAGSLIKRGSLTDYFKGFDEVRDGFVIGEVTSLIPAQIALCQLLATRANTLTDDTLSKWNDTTKQYVDSGISVSDINSLSTFMSRERAMKVVTGSGNVISTDKTIFGRPENGITATQTIITAGLNVGDEFTFKLDNNTTGTMPITSSGLIAGQVTFILSTAFQVVRLKWDGVNFIKI